MTAYYRIHLDLKILGPFLTAAVNPRDYGVDKSFFRDESGQLTIPASHIKGKLRMALEELSHVWDGVSAGDIARWFGRPSGDEEGRYDPWPGKLRFGHGSFAVRPA